MKKNSKDGGDAKKGDKKAKDKAKKRRRRSSRRRQDSEKERQRDWEDSWERKLRAQEELDDMRCCLGEGLCLKPRTQSAIWINVAEDRTSQDILMTFKHVPVPRPKPPPLPRLKPQPKTSMINLKASTSQQSPASKSSAKQPAKGAKGKGKKPSKGKK